MTESPWPATRAPNHYSPHAGLPASRLALIAARRSFVALKLTYMEMVADATGPEAEWLRHEVRMAEEPVDLWLLRAQVFSALGGSEPEQLERRRKLRRALENLFPDTQTDTGYSSL